MGLAVRIIPTLLIKAGRLVKGRQYSADRVVGHPLQAARIHASRGVDELVLLDIDATRQGRLPDLAMIEALSQDMFMPLTVGAGIQTAAHAKALLRAGADKVAIGAGGLPAIQAVATMAGSQAVVASVDTQPDPAAYAVACEQCGAGEILLTAVSREGTLQGYDLDLIRAVSGAVSIPVVAHGGCAGPDDMIAAIKAGAQAVAAGALFQFTEWTPGACAVHMARAGLEMRV